MDPLVEVPLDHWPDLQSKLKDMWPLNVAGFYALYLNIKYPKVREAIQFKVYSPFGDIQNGFVATSLKGNPDCIIFSMSKDTRRLEEAVLKTRRIDWTKHVCIDLVSSLTLEALKDKILPHMNFTYCKIGEVKTYFLDQNTKLFDLRCPPETYLAPLNSDHVRRIDEMWPYKHAASNFYFSTLAANNLVRGLHSTDNNQLVAWVFLNEYNFICHLFCEESYRRKGYAEYLLKCIVNEQLELGNDVYTYVENENEKSSKLFDKLGFVNIDDGAYLFVQKDEGSSA